MVQSADPGNQPPPPPGNRKPWVIVTAVVVVLCCACFGAAGLIFAFWDSIARELGMLV
jgi:hypothetical protein